MAMRLHEVHAALVHYPIALLPLSVGADLIARFADSDGAAELGRRTIGLAAGSAAASAVAGLIAQEGVKTHGEISHAELVTHRTLNLGAVAVTGLMALSRRGRRRAGWGYLAAGLATIGGVVYSAYLGGNMVYKHGVGVESADGVLGPRSPELQVDNAGLVAETAGENLVRGAKHAVEHVREGVIAPDLAKQAASHNS